MKRSHHTTVTRGAVLAVFAMAFGWASLAGAATPAQKCEANKLKASSNKAKCLLRAEAEGVLSGQAPDTSQCVADFEAAFAAAEAEAGPGVCPTEGNVAEIEDLLDACAADVAAAILGVTPAPCGQFPATGQTTSSRTGDDGDIEAGATLSYTDTGNGTILDDNTGLEWEKKSDDGSIHDMDTTYTWENAFAAHIAGLNTAPCFAGHCDWRLPNVKELQSIVNYGPFIPAVSPEFNNCVAGATVQTGSCTAASSHWSSTTFAGNPGNAWLVVFNTGNVLSVGKGNGLRVRAVRGGSE